MAEQVPQDRSERPGRPPGPVARRDVRVSDGERNAVVDELRLHYGAGRIELDEFEDRTRSALSARVRGDLQPLLDDLPDLSPAVVTPAPAPPAVPAVRAPVRGSGPLGAPAFLVHLYLWLVLSAFFVVIWGATVLGGSGAPFWPIFPIAGTGLTVAIHAALRSAMAGPYDR